MNVQDRVSDADAELSQELSQKMNLELTDAELSEELSERLNLGTGFELTDLEKEEIEDLSDSDEEEGEFSFMCGDSNSSLIAAEDAFVNGQIKPIFPFFHQDFTGEEDLPINPPVKNVFVEIEQGMTSSGSGNDDINGPCCEWSDRKAVEVSATCKKSNSTGFSKIWRFKELMGRSNSDGKDTFVFLNDAPHAPPAEVKAEPPRVEVSSVKGKKTSKKAKKPALSAHEVYLKSKAKADRRRSYLPYRPELMGFFTNINGGLTKNVHPY